MTHVMQSGDCEPCWERKQIHVLSTHNVAGTPMCDGCYTWGDKGRPEIGCKAIAEELEPKGDPGRSVLAKQQAEMKSRMEAGRLCECGCGGLMSREGQRYIQGHYGKKLTTEKKQQAVKLLGEGKSQAAVAKEMGVSQTLICQSTRQSAHDRRHDAKGRTAGDNWKPEEREAAANMLKEGESVRQTAKATGLAKNTVLAVRDEIVDCLPPNCACGKTLGHKGWCSTRLEKSPTRQETVKALHVSQRKTETNTIEIEQVRHEGLTALPPAPTGEDASLDSSAEFIDGKVTSEFVNLHLASGGDIALQLYEITLFTMSAEDHEFLWGLIKMFREYAEKNPRKPEAAVTA